MLPDGAGRSASGRLRVRHRRTVAGLTRPAPPSRAAPRGCGCRGNGDGTLSRIDAMIEHGSPNGGFNERWDRCTSAG